MALITLKQFQDKSIGRYRDYDGAYGAQCMDSFFLYLQEVLGIDPKPFRGWGSAINCWNAIVAGKIPSAIQNFKIVKNTPNGVPPRGATVFWGFFPGVTGWAGHVSINESADKIYVLSFDQNYPTGSPHRFYKHGSSTLLHGYRGVKGWLVPNKSV